MPHIDESERVTRALAAELSREAARDRAENEARIRERVEGEPRRGCPRCGDPFATINADGTCDLCERSAWLDDVRDKLSPEELYPEHFPENENDE